MRRRTTLLLVTLLAVLATSMVAQAEPVSPYFYVSPVARLHPLPEPLKLAGTSSDDLSLKDNLYVGGRLGFQWLPWLGIEAAGGYTPTQFDDEAALDINWLARVGEPGPLALVDPNVVPYAFVGGGYNQLRMKEEDVPARRGQRDPLRHRRVRRRGCASGSTTCWVPWSRAAAS